MEGDVYHWKQVAGERRNEIDRLTRENEELKQGRTDIEYKSWFDKGFAEGVTACREILKTIRTHG